MTGDFLALRAPLDRRARRWVEGVGLEVQGIRTGTSAGWDSGRSCAVGVGALEAARATYLTQASPHLRASQEHLAPSVLEGLPASP